MGSDRTGRLTSAAIAVCTALAACSSVSERATGSTDAALKRDVDTIVVIYAENRSFDNLYGMFPGADGIPGVNPTSRGPLVAQTDRDAAGSLLPRLPKVWHGATAAGQRVTVPEGTTADQPNVPFQIDATAGFERTGVVVGQDVVTRDLYHRFWENQMQIDGGRNDKFAAYADSGGLVMGYYDGRDSRLWKLASQYVLADNFFQGAFGGSFLNHQYLICGCVPEYPDADRLNPKSISVLETTADGGYRPVLRQTADSPASAIDGPPRFVNSNNLTPRDYAGDGKFHAVNTMQPAYQPSAVAPAPGANAWLANPQAFATLPPQTADTIADRLDEKGVPWAWYSGAWDATTREAMGSRKFGRPVPNFQFHHQPFNYYARFDPTRPASLAYRQAHLKDFDDQFIADMQAGRLPAVTFYKPQGNLNQHAGYASVAAGDEHIAQLIGRLQASPQWAHMLIIVTYDENGGFWDHKPVPRGDVWGPGTRIPAIIVSPYARRGVVDHTQYDTASILRLITRRFDLRPLPGVLARDAAMTKNGGTPMGDLTAALDLR